jgi:hypothetical protein
LTPDVPRVCGAIQIPKHDWGRKHNGLDAHQPICAAKTDTINASFHVISAGVQPSVMMALAKRAVQMGGNAKFFATAVRACNSAIVCPLSVICVIDTAIRCVRGRRGFFCRHRRAQSRGRHLGVLSATIVSFAPL